MPRSSTKHCEICTHLYDFGRKYAPHQQTYVTGRLGQDRGSVAYGGLNGVGAPGLTLMKRLYVRSGGVNQPVGFICPYGHVLLDNPPKAPRHVVTRTWPATVVCLATGENVETRDMTITGPCRSGPGSA